MADEYTEVSDLDPADALTGAEQFHLVQGGNSRRATVADAVADPVAQAGLLASILGQVAGQINGGQIEVRGGTLDDPALRIGTVGVYSSAADTLSIAIAGTEVARFTAAGLTVYGTVTEA